MSKHQNWFIRRKGGAIKGPFPEGQIEQYLLLGRFVLSDEVSLDKEDWRPIGMIPHLIPELLISAKIDNDAREKLEAKRRWADERRGLEQSHENDRRKRHPNDTVRHDTQKSFSNKTKPVKALFLILLVLLGFGLLGYFSFQYTPQNILSVSNCTDVAGPGVNWSNCRKPGMLLNKKNLQGARLNSAILTGSNLNYADLSGADLSYADLAISQLTNVNFSDAKLLGVVFTNSNLFGANLQNTDLSYANLSGANLRDTNFSDSKLDNTIWFDGRICKKGSVGICK